MKWCEARSLLHVWAVRVTAGSQQYNCLSCCWESRRFSFPHGFRAAIYQSIVYAQLDPRNSVFRSGQQLSQQLALKSHISCRNLNHLCASCYFFNDKLNRPSSQLDFSSSYLSQFGKETFLGFKFHYRCSGWWAIQCFLCHFHTHTHPPPVPEGWTKRWISSHRTK